MQPIILQIQNLWVESLIFPASIYTLDVGKDMHLNIARKIKNKNNNNNNNDAALPDHLALDQFISSVWEINMN